MLVSLSLAVATKTMLLNYLGLMNCLNKTMWIQLIYNFHNYHCLR